MAPPHFSTHSTRTFSRTTVYTRINSSTCGWGKAYKLLGVIAPRIGSGQMYIFSFQHILWNLRGHFIENVANVLFIIQRSFQQVGTTRRITGGETFSFNHTWLTKLHYEGGENVDNEALKVQSWQIKRYHSIPISHLNEAKSKTVQQCIISPL